MKLKFSIKALSLITLSLLAARPLHAGTASSATGNWSDSGTWNNGVPVDGAAVGIVNGATVAFGAADSYTSGTHPNGLTIGADYDQWGAWTGGGAGSLNVTGGNLTSQWTGIGWGAGVGTLNISGGAVALQNTLALGWAGAAGSSINVSGGSLTLSGGDVANVGHGAQASLNVSGAGIVNVNRGLNVQNASTIGISGGTFDIGNSGSLNVTNGAVTVNGGAVTSGSGQDFIGNGAGTSGAMNISSGSFTKSGNTLFLGWADGTGTVNQSGGSATVNELWLGNGGAGTGTYNLSGGTLTVNSLLRFGVFDSGAGVFNQTGGTAELVSVTAWTNTRGDYNLQAGTLKALGNLGFNGAGPAPFINLNLTGTSGNATVDTNGFNITAYNDSIFNNAAATLNKTGAGTLLITSDGASPGQLSITNGALAIQNGTLETSSTITVGNGGTATASISGGTLKTGYLAASNLVVGNGGTGTATQTAGVVDLGSLANVALGWSGTGTYNLNGGTFNAASITYVGLFAGGVGTLNLNGGTYNANNMEISAAGATSGTVNLAGPMTVSGNMSIQPGGVVNVNTGGVLTTPNEVKIDGGTLKLGGGTISVNGGAGYIRNSGTYDINGQTVAAGSYEASYFAVPNAKLTNSSATAATILGWTGSAMKNTVWIPSSGAIIETVGNLTIDSIVTDGGTNNGFTKTGNGTLFLTSSGNYYNGETIINAGTLSLINPTLSDTATVNINGGTLNLNFSGEDQVDKAYAKLGGFLLVRLGPGQYGANDGVGITGSGYLRIAQGYESWAADLAADSPPLADTTRTGDPDNDGLSNAVEYALGLDPRYSNGSPGVASNGGKTITFTKGSEAKYNDKVTYQIETSTTLGAAPSPWTVNVADVTQDTDTISITFPAGPAKDFARLKVTIQ
jgi:autotransporter-associated beta strand protein